uniref:Uncharacterized protein n=1 Tax=Mesocestoides corti TaxID=53468 RepID=A0A5K3G087_MESCO
MQAGADELKSHCAVPSGSSGSEESIAFPFARSLARSLATPATTSATLRIPLDNMQAGADELKSHCAVPSGSSGSEEVCWFHHAIANASSKYQPPCAHAITPSPSVVQQPSTSTNLQLVLFDMTTKQYFFI